MSEGYEGYGGKPDRTRRAVGHDAAGGGDARYGSAFPSGAFPSGAFPNKTGRLTVGHRLFTSLSAGSRILDDGCGTGLPTARRLTDKNHSVVGADPSAGNLGLAARNVPEAELLHRDMASPGPTGPGGPGQFDAIDCFPMAGAELDDAEIPFPGHAIRVSGSLRDTPRRAVCGTGFEIAGENPYAHAPESNAAATEHQLFLNCRRT